MAKVFPYYLKKFEPKKEGVKTKLKTKYKKWKAKRYWTKQEEKAYEAEMKEVSRKAYFEAKKKARIERAKTKGKEAALPWHERLEKRRKKVYKTYRKRHGIKKGKKGKYVVIGGKAYPIARKKPPRVRQPSRPRQPREYDVIGLRPSKEYNVITGRTRSKRNDFFSLGRRKKKSII